MNANPWAAPKSREIRRMLVSLDERIAQACDIVPDEGADPHIVTLRHTELAALRAHVYLHGQRPGTYASSSNTRTRCRASSKPRKTCRYRNSWPAWPCISTPEASRR